MIHNKYYELLEHFVSDYTKERYGRELIRKVSLSQKAIALALDALEKEGILRSRKQGTIKYFRLNLEYTEIRDIILLVEIACKIRFLKKYRVLAYIFKGDTRIVGVFGSYAKGTEKEDSDIDLFIIGKKRKKDYDQAGKLFDLPLSIKYFSEREFVSLLHKKNPLCKEIIKSHILLFGIEQWIHLICGEYYGFD